MPPNLETFEQRKQYSEALGKVFEKQLADLTRQFQDGEIDKATWMVRMYNNIREQHGLMVAVGAGGNRAEVDANDWLKLGNKLKEQYNYLEKFGRDVEAGKTGNMVGRAQMYAKSSLTSFWDTALPVKFPATPKDGSTPCLTNCLCEWADIQYVRNNLGRVIAIRAKWKVNAAESCPVCIQRGEEWNPITIPVGKGFEADPLFKQLFEGLVAA